MTASVYNTAPWLCPFRSDRCWGIPGGVEEELERSAVGPPHPFGSSRRGGGHVLWMNVAVQAKPRDHQGLKIEVIEPIYRDESYWSIWAKERKHRVTFTSEIWCFKGMWHHIPWSLHLFSFLVWDSNLASCPWWQLAPIGPVLFSLKNRNPDVLKFFIRGAAQRYGHVYLISLIWRSCGPILLESFEQPTSLQSARHDDSWENQ